MNQSQSTFQHDISRRPSAAGLAHPAQPQFAGRGESFSFANMAKSLMPALPIFNAISSIFIINFLAQDIIGMWMPRIGVSLSRGAKEYDIWSDPSAQGLSPSQFWLKNFTEKTKRLNWPNFTEEAGREFATGPGILILPTVLYGLVKSFVGGKDALNMALKDLRDYKKTLIHQVDGKTVKQLATSDDVKAVYKQYLTDLFFNEKNSVTHELKNLNIAELIRKDTQLQQTWLKSHPEITQAILKKPANAEEGFKLTLGQAIDDWARLSAEELAENTKARIHGERTPLYFLQKEFKWIADLVKLPYRGLEWGLKKIGINLIPPKSSTAGKLDREVLEKFITLGFKEAHRDSSMVNHIVEQELAAQVAAKTQALTKVGKTGEALTTAIANFVKEQKVAIREDVLMNLDKVTVAMQTHDTEGVQLIRKPLTSIFRSAKEMSAFMEQLATDAAQKAKNGLDDKLPALAEKLYSNIARNKALVSIAFTTLGGLYLYWLSHKVQSHGEYPANRLLNLKGQTGTTPQLGALNQVSQSPLPPQNPFMSPAYGNGMGRPASRSMEQPGQMNPMANPWRNANTMPMSAQFGLGR